VITKNSNQDSILTPKIHRGFPPGRERRGLRAAYRVPLHLQNVMPTWGHKEGDFPVAEKATRECLSLPIYPELTEVQIQRVVEVVKGYFSK
jgi:dTDP-4-amino-4,6-dideoxygalactose transaminase